VYAFSCRLEPGRVGLVELGGELERQRCSVFFPSLWYESGKHAERHLGELLRLLHVRDGLRVGHALHLRARGLEHVDERHGLLDEDVALLVAHDARGAVEHARPGSGRSAACRAPPAGSERYAKTASVELALVEVELREIERIPRYSFGPAICMNLVRAPSPPSRCGL